MTEKDLVRTLDELRRLYESRGLRPPLSKSERKKRKDPRLKTAILIPYAIYTRHQAFFRDEYKPPIGVMAGFNALASVGEPEDREAYEKHCGATVEDVETHQRVHKEGTCKGCS